MAKTFNMHEAKTHLSQLVAAVEKGEHIVISRKGVPVATLTPFLPADNPTQSANCDSPIALEALDNWDETDRAVRDMFAGLLPESP